MARAQKLEGADRDKSSTLARKPLQRRSRERFEFLLDVTDKLLATRGLDKTGLYDIAEEAAFPAASVYHFFPSREAAFIALAERYLTQLERLNDEPLPLAPGQGWQDQFALAIRRSVKFYNAHPVFMSLVLGGVVSTEIHARDLEFNSRYAENAYERMNTHFVMPYLPDTTTPFYSLLGIFDGMMTASYGRFRRVTDEYRDEMIRAIIAYFRTFLPEFLPRQPAPAELEAPPTAVAPPT